MSEPRVIKKYPNRRLYDTVESRYITLADVRRLVVEKVDFVVVDKKNNVDITRSILLQVIAEQEHMSDPILTQDFMVNVIRSYGGNMQALVSGYLDQSLRVFTNQLRENQRDRAKGAPVIDNAPRSRLADEVFKAHAMRDEHHEAE
jgi:polyhydroxyalkanoate synthesis repressor PhaR